MSGSGNSGPESSIGPLVERLFSIVSSQSGLEELPFNDGCSAARLRNLEETLGVSLPDDYRAFLGRANGQSDWQELVFPPDQLAFLSTDEVASLWQESFRDSTEDEFLDELTSEDKVRWIVYHPGRIPIAQNELAGAFLCLDYIPGPQGTEGQLVFNVNEVDAVLLEDDLTALIGRYVRVLEAGLAVVESKPPEHGAGYWFTANGSPVDYDAYRELQTAE